MEPLHPPSRLFDRSEGVAAIHRVVEQTRAGAGSAVFVVGDGGLGKTTLLDLAAELAGDDVYVARGRGQAMEVELPFGLLAQALEPMGGSRLSPPASGSEPAESRVAVWSRARGWLETAAQTTPVLLVLDDLQWSDPDSLELLAFVTRRARHIPVGVVAALRGWPPAAHSAVMGLINDGAADRVELAPLSRSDAHQMLDGLLDHAPTEHAPPDFEARAWELVGGNPFLITQLAKIVVSDGGLPRFPGLEPGESRSALLLSTFASLPSGAIDYARAASVLGTEFRVALVAPVSELDNQRAAAGVEALFGSGVVIETRPGWAAFAHPLVAHAVYRDMTSPHRVRLHGRAFRVLAELGESALAAPHAVLADLVGDSSAVEVITAAATASLAAGAVLRAVEQLRAAVEISAGIVAGSLWLLLAEALLAAGQPAEAADCCRSANLDPDLVGPARVRSGRLLARALAYSGDLVGSGLAADQALAYANTAEPSAVGSLIVEQVHVVLQSAGPGPANELIDRLCGPTLPADPELRAMRCFVDFYARPDDGAYVELAAIVAHGSGAADAASQHDQDSPFDPVLLYLSVARHGERFDAEEHAYDAARTRARDRGLVHAVAALDISMVDSLLRRARLDDAARLLTQIERDLDVTPLMVEAVQLCRAALAYERGDLGEAKTALDASGTDHAMWMARLWAAHLSALIELERGDVAGASDGYAELERIAADLGVCNPCGVPWASAALRAHLGNGRLQATERLCEGLEAMSDRLAVTWPRFTALAGRAGLAAARGDHATARQCYADALALPMPLRLERARVLLDVGAWLRRTNQPVSARVHLAEALAIAEGVGAAGLAARAAAELRVAGGRRRPRTATRDDLTAQELRVAELASLGLTNSAVAQRLSLSVKTIETHLRNVYRKLGVRSRRELRGHHRLSQDQARD